MQGGALIALSYRCRVRDFAVLQGIHKAVLVCTGCGAEANASCNCGVSYVAKSIRAAEAIKANPNRSDRAIAADIGVDHKTVGKARGDNSPPERIGQDGKSYSIRQRTMRFLLILAVLSVSANASLAQDAAPKVGNRTLYQVKPKAPEGCKLVGTVKGTKLWAGDCISSELRGTTPAAETQSLPERAAGAVPPGQK
jgi:hypothetical protein